MRIAIASLFVTVVALGNAACTSDPPARVEQPLAAKQAALVTVQFYGEDDRPSGSCAGVLVGPQAVLTAGHCASNKSRAVVVAPNAGGKKAESHRAWWFDWTDRASPKTSPQLHDVAVLALDTPIQLAKYPGIADDGVADGAKTLHVRRVKSKSKSKISFEAVPGKARAQKDARAHYYKIEGSAGSLDSGGPVFDAKSGKIVGIVSTQGKSRALYVTKTRSLTKWLRQQLLALLEAPPKPPAPTSTTAPKAPTPTAPSTGTSPAPKAPASSGGGAAPSSGGKMGKQDGAGTKAAGKPKGTAPKNTPTKNTDPKTEDQQKCQDGDTECQQKQCEGGGEGGEGGECGGGGQCEGADLECDPDICGSASGGSSSDNCDTPCEGGDQSCQDPQCSEGDSCQCDGDQCGGNEDDPFEDPNYGNENDPVDQASEDSANDEDYSDPSGGDENGGSDDYSESGYDDTGSEDTGSEDTGESEDYGSSEDYGGGEDYSGEE